MIQDLQFAFRQLGRQPGFALVAVVTLALGIGANAAILTMLNALLFKPVLARDPGQLVGLFQHERGNEQNYEFFAFADYVDLRSDRGLFTDLAAWSMTSVGIREAGFVHETPAQIISGNYFATLGVAPALGRGFTLGEEAAPEPVVVVSHDFWRRRGGEASLVGSNLDLGAVKATVIGVMPPGFTGATLHGPDLFLTPGLAGLLEGKGGNTALVTDRGARRFALLARLRPGLGLGNVAPHLRVLSDRFATPDPGRPQGRELVCRPRFRFEFMNRPPRTAANLAPVAALGLGLSLVVLAVACLNLANMMLARGAARRREIGVRLAVGATRVRIVRQLLTEGLLLSLLGAAAGLVLASWATRSLSVVLLRDLGSSTMRLDVSPDLRLLAALGVCAVLATILFAFVPALRLARLEVSRDLRETPGSDVGLCRGLRLSRVLAVGQLAFSLALLAAGGLFVRSSIAALRADPGFEFGSQFLVEIKPSLGNYSDERSLELLRSAQERIRALPGVASVSTAMMVPLRGERWMRFARVAGAPASPSPGLAPSEGGDVLVTYNAVGADYLETLGVPLLAGRGFDRLEAGGAGSPRVAMITRSLAAKLWPGTDPLGRYLQLPDASNGDPGPALEVVGVFAEHDWELLDRVRPDCVYVPLTRDQLGRFHLHVKPAPGMDPEPLMQWVQQELHRLEPGVPVVGIETFRAMHAGSMSVRLVRIGAILFGAFGLVGLVISAVGVYGLEAYAVARRTREIGVRMAVGARPDEIRGMILGEGARLAVLGLALGLLLALGVGRIAGRFLYGVPALDPVAYLAATVAMAAAALLASWIPARRAAGLDPNTALRMDGNA